MCSRRLFALGGGIAASLLVAGSALAQLPSADQKCIDGYNNKLRLVSQQAGKSATKCIQNANKGTELNPENCVVNNTDGKIAGKEAKVTDLYTAGKCTGSEVIQQGATIGNAAHRGTATDLTHGLFGNPIGAISTDKVDGKCLGKAVQRTTQALTEVIKAHRKCKKNAMKAGSVIDETTLDSNCGTFAQIDGAGGGKAAAKLAKISTDVTANCAATTTALPALFDGLSAPCTASATALGLCLQARARCQACFALNEADGQSIDCDVFDNAAADGSCFVPINVGTHTCTLNSPASALNLGTQALPLNLNPSGTVSIACGTTDGLGKAACSCNVVSLAPIVITAIGDVCVNPTSCPSGEIDCNGGNAMDVDLVSDHNIGACASDTACSTACDAHCAGLGAAYVKLSYGCEGYCQGGSNNNSACTADTQCPGGSCTSADPPTHAGTCGCTCQAEGLGPASPAGSLSCPLGTQIDVELPSDGDCNDPNTIVLAPICGGLTSTTATGRIVDANNTAAKTIPPIGGMGTAPNIQTGAPIDCNTAAGSTLTGLKLVGHLGFFDTTLGDIFSANAFTCQ